jgi:peptidoglycan/xylan/chitin deacetylase (PgdA/CDA1 family)
MTAPAPCMHRAPTLMYHSVSPSTEPDPHLLRIHPERLAAQLGQLRRRGLRGVSLGELQQAAQEGRAEKLVALTFDDGYTDFLTHAVPALARYGMTASVYVIAGRMPGSNDWDRDGPRLTLLTPQEVRAVAAAGHEVGSHGYSHIRLSGLGAAELERETAQSRRVLEDVLQAPVRGFCYPYGDHDEAAVLAVQRAGYEYACVTNDYGSPGVFTLPRFYVGQQDSGLRLRVKTLRHHIRIRSRGGR